MWDTGKTEGLNKNWLVKEQDKLQEARAALRFLNVVY